MEYGPLQAITFPSPGATAPTGGVIPGAVWGPQRCPRKECKWEDKLQKHFSQSLRLISDGQNLFACFQVKVGKVVGHAYPPGCPERDYWGTSSQFSSTKYWLDHRMPIFIIHFLHSTLISSFMWPDHNLFKHVPTGGWVGCFNLLAVINKLVVNFHVYISWRKKSSF